MKQALKAVVLDDEERVNVEWQHSDGSIARATFGFLSWSVKPKSVQDEIDRIVTQAPSETSDSVTIVTRR